MRKVNKKTLKESIYFDDFIIVLRPLVERVRYDSNSLTAGYSMGNAVSMILRYMENMYGREEAEQFRDGLLRSLYGEL